MKRRLDEATWLDFAVGFTLVLALLYAALHALPEVRALVP